MSANDVAIYLKVFLTLALFGVVQQKGKIMHAACFPRMKLPLQVGGGERYKTRCMSVSVSVLVRAH